VVFSAGAAPDILPADASAYDALIRAYREVLRRVVDAEEASR
jgi:hypothetical protein